MLVSATALMRYSGKKSWGTNMGDGTSINPWAKDEVPRHTYYGKDAVKKYEEMSGTKLNNAQKRIVEIEGFVNGYYKDHKGILTYGVGQTGEYIQKGFQAAFEDKRDFVENIFGPSGVVGEKMSTELIQLAFRGDIKPGYRWVKMFNEGDFEGASVELLNHQEYKEYKAAGKENSITKRLEVASNVMKTYKPIINTGG